MIWSVRTERKVNIKRLCGVCTRQNTSKNKQNYFCPCCVWYFIYFCLFTTSQGYLPANAERRDSVLQRKRQEYFGFIQQYYDSRNDEHHQDTYRQVYTSSLRPVCVHLGVCWITSPTAGFCVTPIWFPECEGWNERWTTVGTNPGHKPSFLLVCVDVCEKCGFQQESAPQIGCLEPVLPPHPTHLLCPLILFPHVHQQTVRSICLSVLTWKEETSGSVHRASGSVLNKHCSVNI